MRRTWESKVTIGCVLCTVVLVVSIRGQMQELQRHRQAEQAVQQEVVTARAELVALHASPVQRLRPLAVVIQEITDMVAIQKRRGVEVTLTTTAPRALTLAGQTLTAVPCQLGIRSTDLGSIVQVVRSIERGQVVETEWRIDAQGAVLEFYIVDDPLPTEVRREP
jgi:hypothetical protein